MRAAWMGLLIWGSGAVSAAPFLVSDPWPLTGAQPTECVYQVGTAPEVAAAVAAVSATDARVYCKFDLAAQPLTGFPWQVWARNASGASPKVAFNGPPAAPTQLRTVPQ